MMENQLMFAMNRRMLLAAAAAAPLPALATETIKVRWDSYAPESLPTDSLPLKWNQEVLVAIRVIAPPPTVGARNLAIVHTAMYNAWAAYDARAMDTQLGAALRRPAAERTTANQLKAISYAAYLAAIDQFPTQAEQFASFMRKLGYDPTQLNEDASKPEGVAMRSVQALLAYRHHDGSNQLGDLNPKGFYTDHTGFRPYRPTSPDTADLNKWSPMIVGNGMGGFNDIDARLRTINAKPRQPVTVELGGFIEQRYTTPHWGSVLPFGIDSPKSVVAMPPIYFREDDRVAGVNEDNETYADLDALGDDDYPRSYREQVRQVLRYSARLTNREKAIAEYWADGPLSEGPPGHWNVLAHYISRLNGHDLRQDIHMFLVLNNALMDAGITSWHNKRLYQYVRPYQSVRMLFADAMVKAWSGPVTGVQKIQGSQWWPYQEKYFVTPPFPEHTSGHSTFSFAAATALRLFRGSDRLGAYAVVRKGSSSIEIGRGPTEDVQLSWSTLTEAATQAGMSRRYAGLHFAHGDLQGRANGIKVGEAAWRACRDCIEGQSLPVARKYVNLYAS
jgi:hypothetical protein